MHCVCVPKAMAPRRLAHSSSPSAEAKTQPVARSASHLVYLIKGNVRLLKFHICELVNKPQLQPSQLVSLWAAMFGFVSGMGRGAPSGLANATSPGADRASWSSACCASCLLAWRSLLEAALPIQSSWHALFWSAMLRQSSWLSGCSLHAVA